MRSRAEGARIAELWGYPGAGKSTIAASLRDDFGIVTADLPLYRRLPTIQGLRRLSPRFVWNYLPPASPLKRDCRRVISLAIRQRDIVSRNAVPAVFEEGVTHELWRLIYRRPAIAGQTWWHHFLHWGGPLIIHLELDKATALHRISTKSNRGRINDELLSADLRADEWQRACLAHDAILKGLAATGKPAVVTLPVADRAAHDVAAEIADLLKSPVS